jgi:hypothetical protein
MVWHSKSRKERFKLNATIIKPFLLLLALLAGLLVPLKLFG